MSADPMLSRIHYELIRGLMDRGFCPDNSDLARTLGVSDAEVEQLLVRLSDIHGVVLHPHVCEPWVVHPFSVTPTLNWIEQRQRGWWAPCIWCGLGIAVLVGGETHIHTRVGAEADSILVPAIAGEPRGGHDLWVHFAIPPARAWDNVHQHCSMVLAFRSPPAIREWCERHRFPYGEAVPLPQVAQLARLWYGCHADPQWHKWTMAEAQAIFRDAGLTSPFWNLGETRELF